LCGMLADGDHGRDYPGLKGYPTTLHVLQLKKTGMTMPMSPIYRHSGDDTIEATVSGFVVFGLCAEVNLETLTGCTASTLTSLAAAAAVLALLAIVSTVTMSCAHQSQQQQKYFPTIPAVRAVTKVTPSMLPNDEFGPVAQQRLPALPERTERMRQTNKCAPVSAGIQSSMLQRHAPIPNHGNDGNSDTADNTPVLLSSQGNVHRADPWADAGRATGMQQTHSTHRLPQLPTASAANLRKCKPSTTGAAVKTSVALLSIFCSASATLIAASLILVVAINCDAKFPVHAGELGVVALAVLTMVAALITFGLRCRGSRLLNPTIMSMSMNPQHHPAPSQLLVTVAPMGLAATGLLVASLYAPGYTPGSSFTDKRALLVPFATLLVAMLTDITVFVRLYVHRRSARRRLLPSGHTAYLPLIDVKLAQDGHGQIVPLGVGSDLADVTAGPSPRDEARRGST
jgi:hypothetical protein